MLQNTLIDSRIAEISVSYSHPVRYDDRIKMTSLAPVISVLRYVWDERTIELYESFKVILLNRNNRLLGVASIAEGGITNTVVDVRILFAIALKTTAVGIILAHNHPSGNINPSESDRFLTKKIVEGANLLEIMVMDHIIITKDNHYSFKEHDIMPCVPAITQEQWNSNEF